MPHLVLGGHIYIKKKHTNLFMSEALAALRMLFMAVTVSSLKVVSGTTNYQNYVIITHCVALEGTHPS